VRRKVIHHRLRAPNPVCASPLVNNFGGTTRVGIGRFHARFGANMAQVLRLHQHYFASHPNCTVIARLLKNLLKVLIEVSSSNLFYINFDMIARCGTDEFFEHEKIRG
jgi:hypothetical protein